MNTETKICQNCKISFQVESDDFSFYEKIKVPPPTFCPECRFQRRAAWRNERNFHKVVCQAPGHSESIISIFKEPYIIYDQKYWWSDEWDPFSYGAEYDFSISFFKQYDFLLKKVPLPSLWSYGMVNSEYTNYSANSKNIYLCCSASNCENVYYSSFVDNSRECTDILQSYECELCSCVVNGANNSKCYYAIQSRNCIDCRFVYDCVNCQDCFMSSNLRNKRYVFRNTQLTKEEYENALNEADPYSRSSIKVLLLEFKICIEKAIHRFANILKSENVTGDDIQNSKNVASSFFIKNSENISYMWRGLDYKDSRDVTAGLGGELIYEVTVGGLPSNSSKFYHHSSTNKNVEYSVFCMSCSNVFGCVSLRNKQYCIFNIQYSKEEYFELKEKIIAQMKEVPYVDIEGRTYCYGEFFPIELSFFAYNDSMAFESLRLTEDSAKKEGYRWNGEAKKEYAVTLPSSSVPDSVKNTEDSIVSEIIECAAKTAPNCTSAFKILPEELVIYRKLNIPVPNTCLNCRHYERLSYRNPFKLWHRSCMCNKTTHFHEENQCKVEFETSYAPDRSEKVFCERCYQQEVL